MKKFLNIFFVSLGVIFFIILLLIAYLFIFDPFNIKPFINRDVSTTEKVQKTETKTTTSSSNTAPNNLSPTQIKALETVGVDPETIPTNFTPEQLKCFEEKLGESRVTEIGAGDTPTMTEFYQAKDCI